MHKIFISYSRSDFAKVVKLKDEIEQLIGKDSCWIDLKGIESDRQFVDVIIDAIDHAEIFLFMYSKNSDRSEWTRKEIEYAYSEKKKIVFVRLDNYQLSKYYRFQYGGHDIIDVNDVLQKQKLIDNICTWCGYGKRPYEEPYSPVKPEAEKQAKNDFGWIKDNGIEVLLVAIVLTIPLSLLVGVLLFIRINFIGVLLFVLINYAYRHRLQTRYPKYWSGLMKVKSVTGIFLLGLNIPLSAFLLFSFISEYDSTILLWEWRLFIVSCIGLLCSWFRPSILGASTKKKGLIIFGIPTVLYLASICSMYFNENNYDSAPYDVDYEDTTGVDVAYEDSTYVDTAYVDSACVDSTEWY